MAGERPRRKAAITLGVRTGLITVGQSLAKASGLVLALLLVRLLSKDEWATIALLFSIYSVATAFGGMNIHQGIYFFYARLDPPMRRMLAVQTTALLGITGVVAAGIVVGIQPWLVQGPYQVAGLLGWLAVAILLEVPTLGAPQLLLAAERAGGSAAFTSAAALARIVAVIAPLLLGFGLRGAMIGLAGYATLRLLVYGMLVLGLTPAGPVRLDSTLIKEQVIYTAPLGLSLATAALNRNVGQWFVAAFDAPNFGAYAIAATEVPFVSIVPYAIGAVLATRLVHAFKSGRRELTRSYWLASTSRMSLLVIPATIGILLCAPQLIILLFTRDYTAATLPFQIHSVILLHRVAEYGIMLRATGDTRSLWWASFVLLFANVTLGLPLTIIFGMVGAAVAMLVANAIAWIFVLWRIARVMSVTLRAVFPWRVYGRVLVVAGLAALLAAWVASYAADGPVLQLALKVGVFSATFVGAVLSLRVHRMLPEIPEDDPDFVRHAAEA